ncbi:MAG: pantoate--beta-alanine ligase [Candidatus Omnitrophota bacterium]|nr:pantoate--beta-alanine ligase [Candidatus Omnitrophota bacterium]
MLVAKTIAKVKKEIYKAQAAKKVIGFIPTMGALHQGHIVLVKRAKRDCGFVIASIFVNPTQFGPKEDFRKYPRTLQKDKELLENEKVDLVFLPSVSEIYPLGFSTYVEESFLSRVLCGKSRPGHFRGVCTVVAKLFNVVQPDIAYFGHKDYQQAKIIEKMTRDLNFPTKIEIIPTVRESDGLAMSSRNVYLNNEERKNAACLYFALALAKILVAQGERNASKISDKIKKIISLTKAARIDYVKIVDANTLRDITRIENDALIAIAIYMGKTRLVDNIILDAKK